MAKGGPALGAIFCSWPRRIINMLALQVPAFHSSTGVGFTIHLGARGWATVMPMAQEADGARLLFHRGCTGGMGQERARGMAQSKPWVKENYRNRKHKEKTPRKKHCPPAQLHKRGWRKSKPCCSEGSAAHTHLLRTVLSVQSPADIMHLKTTGEVSRLLPPWLTF